MEATPHLPKGHLMLGVIIVLTLVLAWTIYLRERSKR